MKAIFTLGVLFYISLGLDAQPAGNITGNVSFMSSRNIYVRFKSTSGINTQDTLFTNAGGVLVPVLIVRNLSSTSCFCEPLALVNLTVSQAVVAKNKNRTNNTEIIKSVIDLNKVPAISSSGDSVKKSTKPDVLKQKINGSISAFIYYDFSTAKKQNPVQYRYNYSLDARNIGNSKFSVENYISFKYNPANKTGLKNDIFNSLKIYSLNFIYDVDKTTKITIGRRINYKVASMGAMDGLQVEKSLGNFSVGGMIGSRPSYKDYSFNASLFQYGGYLSYEKRSPAFRFNESSIALMQQMNHNKTDRRFVYFQHSNSLLKNIYFTGTFEIDLYKLQNDIPQNTFSLTGLYLSLRYNMTKDLILTASYDQRKNVLFYETYKSFIDSVLEKEKRQSYRLQINYHLTRNMFVGIESGYRHLKSDPEVSENVSGYLTYTQLPLLNASITLSGTYLKTNYITGKTFVTDITKDFFKGKLQTNVGYRYLDYILTENKTGIPQNIIEMGLYLQMPWKTWISANYEGTFEKNIKYTRIYLQFRKRF